MTDDPVFQLRTLLETLSFDRFYGTVDERHVVPLIALSKKMAYRIEALEAEVAKAEARALRYKSERNGLERRVTDVQRQTTASEEAERRIVNQREEIKRLQEIVAHYMRMFPTGEAALDAIAVIEEQPEPVRYVWVVEQDDCIQDTTESLEEALETMDWLNECGMLTPITITRFVEAPE
jgi:predicted RNase H-like nuclease (RuvC/YqgF family)